MSRKTVNVFTDSHDLVLFQWSGRQALVDLSEKSIVATAGDDIAFRASGDSLRKYSVPDILKPQERLHSVSPTRMKEWRDVLPLLVEKAEGITEEDEDCSPSKEIPNDLIESLKGGDFDKNQYVVVLGFDGEDEMTWDRVEKQAESSEEAKKLATHTGMERAKHHDRGGLAFTYVMHGPDA